MGNLKKFATVDNVEVMLAPGRLGIEPVLLFKDKDKFVEMTLSSNVYENELGKFVFYEGLSGERRAIAEKIMNELSSDVERVGKLLMFQLKPEYQEKLTNIIQTEIEEGRYYDL